MKFPQIREKVWLPAMLLFATAVAAGAQEEAVTIDRVDFKSQDDDWVRVAVEMTCNENPLPEARDRDYVEDVNVKVYLAYPINEAERQFDFYVQDVDIVIMERGEDYNVYFYLPGLIVERDGLPTDPDYYFVEVSVGGNLQPPQESGLSSKIPNRQILESMKSKAEAEAGENEDVLMPVYYAPAAVRGRVEDLPVFLRRSVEG